MTVGSYNYGHLVGAGTRETENPDWWGIDFGFSHGSIDGHPYLVRILGADLVVTKGAEETNSCICSNCIR